MATNGNVFSTRCQAKRQTVDGAWPRQSIVRKSDLVVGPLRVSRGVIFPQNLETGITYISASHVGRSVVCGLEYSITE